MTREQYVLSRCPGTGKVCFETRKKAKDRLKAHKRNGGNSTLGRGRPGGRPFNIYRCESCGLWHIGHLPCWVEDMRKREVES